MHAVVADVRDQAALEAAGGAAVAEFGRLDIVIANPALYTLADAGKRAVGFKLSDGMEVPEELSTFKFARQKSKLAGTIRGSYFVIKGEY